MPTFSLHDIAQMPERFRANFINALSGVKSANIIGSISKSGNVNAALFSSAFHLGASPPLIGIVCRPNSVPRHTLENIESTGYYTINHVNQSIYKQAHQTSARTEEDEFQISGLEPEFIDGFRAPFVSESHIKLGIRYMRTIGVPENHTHIIIGEIQFVSMSENYVTDTGDVDLNAAGSIGVTGLYAYQDISLIDRLPHARA
ncbi:MAG: flavin reductase [bacterium]|nr:flavin reductase [bacterium]